MPDVHNNHELQPTFTDVQRRVVFAETVTKDGVPVLSVDKQLPGGSSKRLLLLNKTDAQAAIRALERYLNHIYAQELNGINASLSPADMLEIFEIGRAHV